MPIKKTLNLAPYIDHTLLTPNVTHPQLKRLCEEALKYGFASVCVRPEHIAYISPLLKGSSVKPISVVSFPLGTDRTDDKVEESHQAIADGAQEIDMVINIQSLKNKEYKIVYNDIERVVRECRDIPVKVILETSALDHDEKVIGCVLANLAGAAFVKTSTGFGSGGATVADVILMRKIVGEKMGVKASGGIKTLDDAIKMIESGATRLGCSKSVALVTK